MPLQNDAAFPLILTFSLGEKEQPLIDFVKLESVRAVSSYGSARSLERFPLSPGEMAGVRGNTTFKHDFQDTP
jgi:hypothetical protein